VFSLTRKTDYALVALATMAQQSERMSARGLADRLNLPLPVLRNILKQLTQQGLINSTRGQQGGYHLARGPERISLVELIEAMEGPLRLTMCCRPENDPQRHQCDVEDTCTVKRPVQRVHRLMKQFLSHITLAQIADDDLPSEVDFRIADDARHDQSAGQHHSSYQTQTTQH
jgi:Rrf2 family protein